MILDIFLTIMNIQGLMREVWNLKFWLNCGKQVCLLMIMTSGVLKIVNHNIHIIMIIFAF